MTHYGHTKLQTVLPRFHSSGTGRFPRGLCCFRSFCATCARCACAPSPSPLDAPRLGHTFLGFCMPKQQFQVPWLGASCSGLPSCFAETPGQPAFTRNGKKQPIPIIRLSGKLSRARRGVSPALVLCAADVFGVASGAWQARLELPEFDAFCHRRPSSDDRHPHCEGK